jgi:hypothetical protein
MMPARILRWCQVHDPTLRGPQGEVAPSRDFSTAAGENAPTRFRKGANFLAFNTMPACEAEATRH